MKENKKLELSDGQLVKAAGGVGGETVAWCKHCQKETPVEDRNMLVCKVCGRPTQNLLTVVVTGR